MIRTAFAALALSAVAVTAAPGTALAAGDPKPSDLTDEVFIVTDTPTCWATPAAQTYSPKASLRTSVGALLKATPARFRGPGIGGGDEVFRWVQTGPGRQGCYVPEGFASEALPGPVDPSAWTGHVIVAPASSGSPLGAILTRSDRVLFAAPALNASQVGDVEVGDVLAVAPWTLTGETALSGVTEWRPVVRDGVVAWMRAGSLLDVPALKVSDLTSSLTPSRTVVVWTLPGAGEQITDLDAGVQVPAGASPTLGHIPVAVDGQVGWVAQADLLDDGAATPSAEPSAGPSEPGLLDQGRDAYDDWRAERDAAQAERDASGEPSLWDRITGATQRNPVVKAVDTARLWTAGGLAFGALLLAGLAILLARTRRGIAGAIGSPMLTVARLAALPAAVALASAASWLAPRTFYTPRVLLATAVLGAVLAWALAHRIALARRADTAAIVPTARERTGALVAFGAVAAAFTWIASDGVLAPSLLAGFLATGVSAGMVVSRSTSALAAPRIPSPWTTYDPASPRPQLDLSEEPR